MILLWICDCGARHTGRCPHCAPERAKAQRASLGWVFLVILVLRLLLVPDGRAQSAQGEGLPSPAFPSPLSPSDHGFPVVVLRSDLAPETAQQVHVGDAGHGGSSVQERDSALLLNLVDAVVVIGAERHQVAHPLLFDALVGQVVDHQPVAVATGHFAGGRLLQFGGTLAPPLCGLEIAGEIDAGALRRYSESAEIHISKLRAGNDFGQVPALHSIPNNRRTQ